MGRARTLTGDTPETENNWRRGIEVVNGYARLRVIRTIRKCPKCHETTARLAQYGEAWGYHCVHCGHEGKQVHPNAFDAYVWFGRSETVKKAKAKKRERDEVTA